MTLQHGADAPGFIGGTLDRADHIRGDEAGFAALAQDWRARVIALDGLDPIVDEAGRLAWRTLADFGEADELILLGLDDGRPRFAALPPGPARGNPDPRALWPAIEAMEAGDAATYAAARSLLDWHARHRFCANCGGRTDLYRAGWGRRCGDCAAEHFPRVDPVVIMLAEHDDRVLVGRQARWPRGRYSALAGFIEPGESIEEAVARELREEAGVDTLTVRYVASQPWPFPSSLMIAAVATVADAALTLDATEIEDAFWVTRDEVADALEAAPGARFIAPPRIAIANTLFRRWLATC